jgi:hypothetical protein
MIVIKLKEMSIRGKYHKAGSSNNMCSNSKAHNDDDDVFSFILA